MTHDPAVPRTVAELRERYAKVRAIFWQPKTIPVALSPAEPKRREKPEPRPAPDSSATAEILRRRPDFIGFVWEDFMHMPHARRTFAANLIKARVPFGFGVGKASRVSAVIQSTLLATEMNEDEFFAHSRERTVARARQTCALVLHRCLSLSYPETARAIRLHSSTTSEGIKALEDRITAGDPPSVKLLVDTLRILHYVAPEPNRILHGLRLSGGDTLAGHNASGGGPGGAAG